MRKLGFLVLTVFLLASCVSKKDFLALQGELDKAKFDYNKIAKQLSDCNDVKAKLEAELAKLRDENKTKGFELKASNEKMALLEKQLAMASETKEDLMDRLADLSVISKTGAESIRKSLETMDKQNKYINNLNASMARKDSVNLALVMNLKRSLGDVNSNDVSIEVKKGVVYISLSDKLLFRSGSADVNANAEGVLGKIAKIVNDHSHLDILVEGHTDNEPIKMTKGVKDNWELSAKRATAVVRILEKKYGVSPARMTAGGRSEYQPKADNGTKEGRAINRRTEIIILPKLDEFFKLMERPQ